MQSSEAGDNPKATKEPRDSKFTQQNLAAWRPVFSPCWVTVLFFSVGLILIPVGIACLVASHSVVEVSARYDNRVECSGGKDTNEEREKAVMQGDGLNCSVTVFVEKSMSSPVYLYYELENFYQNHRRYVKSRSDEQLIGENPSSSDLKDCEPRLKLNKSAIINPCGLTAWSLFNDTYDISTVDPDTRSPLHRLDIKSDSIAWESDVDHKFADYTPENFNTIESKRGGGEIQGSVRNDEHFIVWMRTAAMPRFRKLWGKIDTNLPKGTMLKISIQNRYNTYRFDGRKSVVLSTTSWLGGKNDFLGIAYLTAGCVSVFCSLVFFLLHVQFPRKQGDDRFLSWTPLE
ncbi:hypothetical protein BSKO_10687 [Bryopsis sp. KO-2023]|nr:hypothetical protein BSKO_10687 [Bryopsis sp. KO-2023]